MAELPEGMCKNIESYEEVVKIFEAQNDCKNVADCERCYISKYKTTLGRGCSTVLREARKCIAENRFNVSQSKPQPNVTCKDCIHVENILGLCFCIAFRNFTEPDGYCHRGKEKENE